MLELSTLSDIAQGEIATLESEGINLTHADIVEINYLSHCVDHPRGRVSLSRGNPVFIGDVALWPLTLHANDWVERVLHTLIGDRLKTLAYAYAMAYGRDELDCSYLQLIYRLEKFYRSLKCTQKELKVAIGEVLAQDETPEMPPQDSKNKPMTIGEFSAFLFATCGESPEFWERRCSSSYAMEILTTSVQQTRADDRPLESDPRIKAEIALGWCLEKIRKRHNG